MAYIKFARSLPLVLAACSGKLAFAGFVSGATLTYSPATAANVPTLSEWTLLALTALVAVISYRHLRMRLNGRPLAALFLASAAGLTAFVAGHVGETAVAVPLMPGAMTLQGGGTINLSCGTSGNVLNSTSITMAVTAVTNVGVGSSSSGTCKNLPTMAPSASCSISVACP